ncbi:MAG: serine/threonine protein kinase [Candidatus Obscuribacterales bacterium]|nr:serine/threonine protein kinase [Candidatus Obscuribacterales bacterium]
MGISSEPRIIGLMRTIQLNESLVGQVLEGDYTILELLGSGGFGAAYRARQASLGRDVCIKFLGLSSLSEAQSVQRFKREAKVLGRLRHKNIVECYSFGILEKVYPFLVMELVEGRSLRNALDSEALEWPQACAIVRQVCEALCFAHDSGFIHRDVKPENIMLSGAVGSESVKLIDFGLVGKSELAERGNTLTSPGTILGTARYMPPEAFSGVLTTSSGDLYAIGCVLYECLSGLPPFDFDSPIAIMHIKNSGERLPPLPSTIKPDTVREVFEQLVWTATASERSQRFDSVRDIIRILTELEQIARTGNQCDSALLLAPPIGSAAPRKRLRLVPVVACLVLLVVAGLVLQKISNRGVQPQPQAQFALAESATVRAELTALIARVKNILQESGGGTPEMVELSIRRYCQLLDHTLFKYGSSPTFSANVQLRELGDQLCLLTGELTELMALGKNDVVKRSLHATYADLLSCCGHYSETLSVVRSNEPTKFGKLSRGSHQDLLNLFDELRKEFDSASRADERSVIVSRIRPSALSLSLVAEGSQFVRYLDMYRTVSVPDPWKPGMGQIGLHVHLQGKAQQVRYFCNLAEIEKDIPVVKELLLRAVAAGTIPLEREQFVISNLYRVGGQDQALKLFNSAQERFARRGDSISWCARSASMAYAMACSGDLRSSQELTDKLLSSPQWAKLLQNYAKMPEHSISLPELQCVTDTASVLIHQATLTRQDASISLQKMKVAAEILLSRPVPSEEVLLGFIRYTEYGFGWRLKDDLSFEVVQTMSRKMRDNLDRYGPVLPYTDMDYTGRLLQRNEPEQAKVVFALAESQLRKYLTQVRARRNASVGTLQQVRVRLVPLRGSIFSESVETMLSEIDDLIARQEASQSDVHQ